MVFVQKEPHDYWLEEREKAIEQATREQAFTDAEEGALKLNDAINGFDEVGFKCQEIEQAHILVNQFLSRCKYFETK